MATLLFLLKLKNNSGYYTSAIQIVPRSAADVYGQIKIGEEILSINGVDIAKTRTFLQAPAVCSIFETRDNGVELVVSEAQRVKI